MMGYPYSKLDPIPFEIRLLSLEPGDWSSEIECRLSTTALESASSYEALSYTWGDASNTRENFIDGLRCTVTESLELALRHIRRKDAARTLWVDALCINQEDVDECSQQVGRMMDIFKTSARVLAWTGVASDDSDEALDILAEFGRVILEILKDDGTEPSDFTSYRPAGLLQRGFDASSKNWPCLWRFWNRPYWGRVWIISGTGLPIRMAPQPEHGWRQRLLSDRLRPPLDPTHTAQLRRLLFHHGSAPDGRRLQRSPRPGAAIRRAAE